MEKFGQHNIKKVLVQTIYWIDQFHIISANMHSVMNSIFATASFSGKI